MKKKVRLIDVSRLATILGKAVCTALVAVHAWTGCDSVSAFAGQGKVKAINLIRKSQTYREAFMAIGQEWDIPDELFNTIQAFTCSMYSANTKTTSVNKMR